MKVPKLVYIEWDDSHSSDKWQSIVEAKLNMSEMMHCKTVGYQITRTREFIVVANTIAWEEDIPIICGVFHIPMRSVKLIKELEDG